jgi:hopene-associated glycosyltransferase HpnB
LTYFILASTLDSTWIAFAPRFLGAASLGVWIYLLLARGGFWRLRFLPPFSATESIPQRAVAVIVPARNEADVAARAVRSLLEQNCSGRLHVFLVDDESSDGTAEVAQAAAEGAGKGKRLTIVRAGPLPLGWTGKLWALSEGVRAAAPFDADFFLFADADIVHGRDAVAALVSYAENAGLDMVSLMARLSCSSFAERAVIPAFVYFFFMLYPPAWVGRRERRTAAAAGGCILIRKAALERVGGIAAIRGELIDDCALARAVKHGGSIWLGPAADTCSIRNYTSWGQLDEIISRTAFTQLDHSFWILLGTIAAMTITYLAPPLLLAAGSWAALLGGCSWGLMSLSFWPMLRYYRRSPLWAPLLPLIAIFFLGATIHSAILYWRGHGGLWKGRVQDPAGV